MTRVWRASLVTMMTLALGCVGPGLDDEGSPRQPLGKADAVGTCSLDGEDWCGEKSTGNCWCDDACEAFGDCCEDYRDTCRSEGGSCSAEPFYPGAGLELIDMLVTDGYVYWTSYDSVRRKPTAGGPVETIAERTYDDGRLVHPSYLAQTTTHVFWTNYGTWEDQIYRAAKATNTVELWVDQQQHLRQLVANGEYVYWLHRRFIDGLRDIRRRRLGESGWQEVPGYASTKSYLALDATHLYWSNGNVRRLPVSDTSATADWVSADHPTTGVAVDDSYIYWFGAGTLKRRGKSLGRTETIASSAMPHKLVTDATDLYFVADDMLQRVPKSGGTPEILAEDVSFAPAGRFAVGTTYVYWCREDGIWRTPKICP